MRLDKFLAESSIGTRKAARSFIIDGKVTVNNKIILEPAAEIDENTDNIRYLGEAVIHTGRVYYMLHKPGGCVTARVDAVETTVLDYFEPDCRKGLFPVGRLDKDTEGLIILTNDGELNHRLMHPDKHVEKTYFFWAFGTLDSKAKECLEEGVVIGKEESVAKALKLQVEVAGAYEEYKEIMNLANVLSIKKKDNSQPVAAGYITISEGRKHQVKRMLKAIGCYVVYLKRVSIGALSLDENLRKGQYRALTMDELRLLQ